MGSFKDFNKKKPVEGQIEFLNIPEDGSATVQILGELDELHYIVEHSAPSNWRKHGLCTIETGKCYACEQQERGWNQKIRIFIPVLHDGRMKVLSSGMGVNSVIHPLQRYLSEHGTIMDTEFRISRSGKGKRTKYDAVPVADSGILMYNGDTSLSDLKKSMDYSEQANYYK